MKKYSQFILDNVNEGFIKDLLGGIKSFIKGDKNSILNNVAKMKEVEKDFIQKSDELSFIIFNAESRKNQNADISPAARQKSLMSKRALEALKISKEGEINLIAKVISKICKGNPTLIDFYNKEKSEADVEIAQYAYEKAKKFKDLAYADEFYDQWKNLETASKNLKYDSSGLEDDTIEQNSGMWDLSLRQFTDEIMSLPKNDLLDLVEAGSDLRWKLADDLRVKDSSLRDFKTKSYRSGDMESYSYTKEKIAEIKNKYRVAIQSVDNKVSVIKSRLRNI